MRIVMLGTRGFPEVQGGVEKHCQFLSVHLVKLGCEVIVIARCPYVDPKRKQYEGVKLIPLFTFKRKGLEAFFHTFIGVIVALRFRPDILHIHGIGPGFFVPLAKALGLKVVLTSHGSNYEHLKWGPFEKAFLRLCEYVAVHCADSIIAVSKTIREEILTKYSVVSTHISNGLCLSNRSESADVLHRFHLTEGRFILSVGRLVPEKGFDILIRSFRRAGLPEWKVVIAGKADHENSYSRTLEAVAKEDPSIVLTGFLDEKDLSELYKNAGLFVLASRYEGLPLALIEAVSHGVSSIASDIKGNRNIELQNDRFFPPGDIQALSRKIAKYVENPLNGEEMYQLRRKVRSKYDWNQIARKTLQVYHRVLGVDGPSL